MKKILVSFVLFFSSLQLSFAKETAKPQLTFIGHATVLIEGRDINLLTDPFFGNQILGKVKRLIPPAIEVRQLPRIDVVLISHTHPDHFDLEAIKKLTGQPVVILPCGRAKDLKNLDFVCVELRSGQSYRLSRGLTFAATQPIKGKVTITAVTAKHMYGHCLGYIIEIDGKKIYFTGDTKLFAGLERLKEEKIDLMLLPYDGYPVMGSVWTINQAVIAVTQVHPRTVIPIHWGTFNRWWTKKQAEPPEVFCEMIKKSAPEISSLVLQTGESLNLDSIGLGN